MIKNRTVYVFAILTIICSCKTQSKSIKSDQIKDQIKFEISEYNLLFTKVEIDNNEYTALIDFGDFAEFQVSTKLISELKLETKKSDMIMFDINGNEYALEKGTIDEIKVDGITNKNVSFFSAKNEIEAVSKEVGTDFQVVIGFGYFKSKDFKLDFVTNSIDFVKPPEDETDFRISIDNDYGYLIGYFKSDTYDNITLLLDTGTPISKIDLKHRPMELQDSNVIFLNTKFPSKVLNVNSTKHTIALNMENSDISELEPLGVDGIYGVNDMIGKEFIYDATGKSIRIKTTGNR